MYTQYTQKAGLCKGLPKVIGHVLPVYCVYCSILWNCLLGGSARKRDVLRLDQLLRLALFVGLGLDSAEKLEEAEDTLQG